MNTPINSQAYLSWEGSSSHARRLGASVHQPQRRYFIDIPLLLLSVGLLTWMLPTDRMLLVSGLTGGAAGVITFWDIVVRRGPIRVSHVFCVANTVGYGLGLANSWLTIPRGDMTLAAYFDRDPEAVAQAMATVLISSAILYSLGEIYEPPVFRQNFTLRLDNRTPAFIFVGTLLIVVGVATGKLGYMGVSVDNGKVSFLDGLIGWISPTLFAFTCIAFLQWPKRLMKWSLGATVAMQFLLAVPTGRRNILYFVLLALIATRFSDYKMKGSILRKGLLAAVLAVLVGVGALAFYYMRSAALGRQHISLLDRVSLAWDLYSSGKSGKVNQDFAQNLQGRTFVLGYVSDLLDASFHMKPAKGADAWHEFELSIPSAFWANKGEILYNEESLANTQFHFAYSDQPNSIYSAGALDFGFLGMVFYPVLVAVLFRAMAEFVRINMPETVSIIVILALLFNALMTEGGLVGRFLTIRNSLLFSGVLWLFFKMPAFSMSRQAGKFA